MSTTRSLLPSNATPLDLGVAGVGVESMARLESDLAAILDPMRTPAKFIPWLAWARSIDLWRDDWDDYTKRKIAARFLELHRLKGTIEGFRQHIEIGGGELLDYIIPPQGLFLAGPVDKAAWDEYLDKLPEIRIYVANERETQDDGLFLDHEFLDDRFLNPDRSAGFSGRKSRLYRGGTEVPLTTYQIVTRVKGQNVVDYERIEEPGDAGFALMLDADFLDASFLDGEARAPKTYTIRLDRMYDHFESEFPVTPIRIGYKPVTPRYEKGSVVGDAGWSLMLDADFLDDNRFYVPDDADSLIFDRLRLFDPDIDPPFGQGDDFLDDARLGIAPYTAEFMVKAQWRKPEKELFLDNDFLDDGFITETNLELPSRVMDAIVAAKAHRDKILVTFETTQPLTLDQGFDLFEGVKFGKRIRKYL